MASSPRYVVFGAGNGGCAMAAELALLGRDVTLLDHPVFESSLGPLRELGGIMVESRISHFTGGIGTHFAPLPKLSTDASLVRDGDMVIVVVPGPHHGKVIDALLPYLRPGQLILLNPGGVGGALVWAQRLRSAGLAGVLLAQAADLLYAGYRTPQAKVVIGDKKKRAFVGVFPNRSRDPVMAVLRTDFPEFVPAANVIEAGLQGPGMLVHPLPMLMNAVRIDRDAPFTYDAYDITPSVASAVSALDRERMAIVRALGGEVKSIHAILGDYYGVSGNDFYDTVRKVSAYRQASAPKDFSHRYITEEVPTHIVPARCIAGVLGIPTPIMDAVVALASAVAANTFAETGWTLKRLGLTGMDRLALLRHLEDG